MTGRALLLRSPSTVDTSRTTGHSPGYVGEGEEGASHYSEKHNVFVATGLFILRDKYGPRPSGDEIAGGGGGGGEVIIPLTCEIILTVLSLKVITSPFPPRSCTSMKLSTPLSQL